MKTQLIAGTYAVFPTATYMNKPILVKDNTEWTRLASVLEKKGYYMPDAMSTNPTAFVFPFFPVILMLKAPLVDWYSIDEYQGETQTVDEYLLNASLLEMGKVALKAAGAPEDTPIFATTDYNHKPKPWEKQPTPFPTNYQELYEAQTRAIGEALGEMDKEIDANESLAVMCIQEVGDDSNEYTDFANGLNRAKEILSSKLK